MIDLEKNLFHFILYANKVMFLCHITWTPVDWIERSGNGIWLFLLAAGFVSSKGYTHSKDACFQSTNIYKVGPLSII